MNTSLLDFDFTVETDQGATYTPWTNGFAVGYKVTDDGKPDRYILLNPSEADTNGEDNVFVYLEDEDPRSTGDMGNALAWFLIWESEPTYTTAQAAKVIGIEEWQLLGFDQTLTPDHEFTAHEVAVIKRAWDRESQKNHEATD